MVATELIDVSHGLMMMVLLLSMMHIPVTHICAVYRSFEFYCFVVLEVYVKFCVI